MQMNRIDTVRRVAGFLLHLAVCGLMIMAGTGKLFGFAPPEVVDNLNQHGLGGQIKLIATGELLSALLLLVPWTESLGLLLTSGFWGGVICYHMSHGESYAQGGVLLLLTWVGAWLRYPETLVSFRRRAAWK
jgi:hypothetical protein